jgi:hypothetical protein
MYCEFYDSTHAPIHHLLVFIIFHSNMIWYDTLPSVTSLIVYHKGNPPTSTRLESGAIKPLDLLDRDNSVEKWIPGGREVINWFTDSLWQKGQGWGSRLPSNPFSRTMIPSPLISSFVVRVRVEVKAKEERKSDLALSRVGKASKRLFLPSISYQLPRSIVFLSLCNITWWAYLFMVVIS